MVGWRVGRTIGRTIGRSDGRTGGRTGGRSDNRTSIRSDGRSVGRTDGRTDGTVGRTGWVVGRAVGRAGWSDGRTVGRSVGRSDGYRSVGARSLSFPFFVLLTTKDNRRPLVSWVSLQDELAAIAYFLLFLLYEKKTSPGIFEVCCEPQRKSREPEGSRS
jgi:hypothetical protein